MFSYIFPVGCNKAANAQTHGLVNVKKYLDFKRAGLAISDDQSKSKYNY